MRVQRRGPSTVRIGPTAGNLGWNEERRQMEAATADPVYNGPAILGPLGTARDVVAAEDDVSVRTYGVELDLDYPGAGEVTSEHVITIVESPDALLEGRVLDVTTVDRGNPRRRRIVATLND